MRSDVSAAEPCACVDDRDRYASARLVQAATSVGFVVVAVWYFVTCWSSCWVTSCWALLNQVQPLSTPEYPTTRKAAMRNAMNPKTIFCQNLTLRRSSST